MKLIDKDAVIAKIEELDEFWHISKSASSQAFVESLLSFIDTLEVKEADFGTEVYKYIGEHFNVYDDGNQTLQNKDKKSLIGRVDVENIAKHFFELGIKAAQKGE